MANAFLRFSAFCGVFALIGSPLIAEAQTSGQASGAVPSAAAQQQAAPLPALPPPAPAAPPYGAQAQPPPGYPLAPPYAAPGVAPPPQYDATASTARAPAANSPLEMRPIEGRPTPPGYHPETRARRGLVITGSLLFGIPYALSLSSAASSTVSADHWLYMPVFGPFVDLAIRGDRCTRSSFATGTGSITTESCSDDSASRFFLMLDGLMQASGATMFILGLALPQHLLVRDDAPFSATGKTFAWTVRPQKVGREGYGVGIDGTF